MTGGALSTPVPLTPELAVPTGSASPEEDATSTRTITEIGKLWRFIVWFTRVEPISLTTAHTKPLLSFHHFNTTSVPLGVPLISPLPFLSLPPNHFLFLSMFIQKGSAVTQSGASFGHLPHMPCRHPGATLCFQMVVLWHALDSFLHLVLHDSTQSECRGM